MLVLKYQTAPYWLELIGGLRIQVRPFSATVLNTAKDGVEAKRPENASARLQFSLLAVEVAKVAVMAWEGVADADGAALDYQPDLAEWVFDIPAIHDDFTQKYLVPGLLMGVEKNEFAPALNGISVGAQNTAADVSMPMGIAAQDAPLQ